MATPARSTPTPPAVSPWLPSSTVTASCWVPVNLIGTGRGLLFPAASLLAPLASKRIGFEIMDTGAACRAYNFLLGEGRQVAAGLLMIE
ncbi:MAG: hypothetical protein HYY48_12055 [Gammaproteobacteria bacterium]|nr:hypothetical protein [Gammaproteobacteria bacterium]